MQFWRAVWSMDYSNSQSARYFSIDYSIGDTHTHAARPRNQRRREEHAKLGTDTGEDA